MIHDKGIFIKNIYYMLSYAFTALRQGHYENLSREHFENIHNLLAAILSKGISQQLKQGLGREYVNCRDNIPAIRGKVDMPGTMHSCMTRKRLLTCDYDELSENHLLNQLLKRAALLLIYSEKVEKEYKDALKKSLLFFSQIDTADPASVKWRSIRFHRHNYTYRMLIGLCRLIFDGMLLTTAKGTYQLTSFLDEQRMCRLYEKFILEYYRKTFSQIKVSASQIDWQLDDGMDEFLPVMQTDTMLSYQDKVLIIDAKYYTHTMQERYSVHTLHSGNLYQIFTYVKNKEVELAGRPHEVSGVLLYAKTDEDIVPNHEYHMSGNAIGVRTLDLNQDFTNISRQLNDIATQYLKIK